MPWNQKDYRFPNRRTGKKKKKKIQRLLRRYRRRFTAVALVWVMVSWRRKNEARPTCGSNAQSPEPKSGALPFGQRAFGCFTLQPYVKSPIRLKQRLSSDKLEVSSEETGKSGPAKESTLVGPAIGLDFFSLMFAIRTTESAVRRPQSVKQRHSALEQQQASPDLPPKCVP